MSSAHASPPAEVDAQNRVLVPALAREALGLSAGDFVVFDIQGTSVRLRKVRWEAG